MGNDVTHLAILNKQLQLLEFAGGTIGWEDTENMYLDEFEYIIYNYKLIFDQKENAKQEKFKAIFEYANKAIEQLFKLLGNLGKGR
jgi:hypothetical protein